MTPLEDDRPTLLLFGDGEPMLDALVAALRGHAIVTVEDDADSAVAAVLANVPDVTVFVGRAAEPERATELLHELVAHPLTSSSPVALLSSDSSLDARLRAAEHGAVTIVQRGASADAMARQMLELATRLYDDPGVHEAGELAEASVDDLVQILGRELQSGILSITQTDGARAERFVVRAGQPMRAAIKQFIERVRPLIAEAKPLRYAFHEAPVAPLWTLDDEAEAAADGSARTGLRERRFLLIANNPAAADALAQELRANGALVVVMSADGSGWDRARDLDPEIALIDEEGLNHWGFDAVARLRADPQLRWASLVVMDAKELLPGDGPPRVERLAANIAKLTESDAALRARAATHEVFDARLETVGPTRLVRALLSTGGAWNLNVRPRGGALLKVALAEGLVAGASAQLPDGRALEGAAAFACLLVAGAGRLRAEPATHPALANMLMPLDEAVRAAHAEGSPLPVTHSPSAPPPPLERPSRPSSPPRPRAIAASTETDALVGELEELVGGLQEALVAPPPPPATPGRTAQAAPRAPGAASAIAGAPTKPAAPAVAKPASPAAPRPASPAAAKPAMPTAAKPAMPTAAKPAMPTAAKPAPSQPQPPSVPQPVPKAPPASAAAPVAAPAPPVRAPLSPPRATAKPTLAGIGANVAAIRAAAASPAPATAPRSAPARPVVGVAVASGSASAAVSSAPTPDTEHPDSDTVSAARPVASVASAPTAPPPPRSAPVPPRGAGTHPPPRAAGSTSLPPPPPEAAVRSLPPPPPATRTSLPPPASARTAQDAIATLPPLPMTAAAEPLPPATPPTRPPPPMHAAPPAPPMQAAPPTQAASVQAVPARPAAPAERAPASAPARPVPAPAPAPAQHATSPTQPSRAVPMPQPPHAPVVPAAPSELADVLEAPRSPRVSPMHVVIGLGVVIAGLAGFALVFWFARQEPDPPAAPEAIAVAVTSPPPGTASVAAAPTPAPAMPPPPPAAARASVPTAPRLPFVDPGPMPEEHAGAAAIVDRYRESLARGSRARSRGDLEVALQSYRFAVHLKPRSTEAILGVARTYEDAGQFEDALRWAERARDVELRGIEGRLMVGDLQLELGRHDQAIATWREAQAIAPRERAPEERIRRAEEALAERD